MPIVAGAAWLIAAARPTVAGRDTRVLDIGLCVCLLIAAAQLVPLSPRARLALSPSLARIDRALYLDAAPNDAERPRPLSVDPIATAEAVVAAGAIVVIFWSARTIFERGSVRTTLRAIAMCGLVLSAIAIVQHATAPGLIYWMWQPVAAGTKPYGPFVSRNDLAAWLVMAIPLTIGYIVARFESRRESSRGSSLAGAMDATTVWLGAAVCAMAAALLASLSRSGLTAGAAGLMSVVLLSRGRLAGHGRAALIAALAVVVMVAAAYTNIGAMMLRLNDALANGVGGRRDIWSLTRTMIDDFRLVGVGVGAYARAMSVYQPPHLFAYNHAHDEYLQVLAEGGVVLSAAAIVVVIAGAIRAARVLARDRSPMFWIRAGAVSALVAIAVQSIWETGLRMPANAILFAICAAVALHASHRE